MKYIKWIIGISIFSLHLFSTVTLAASCNMECTKNAQLHRCATDCKVDETADCYCEEDGTPTCNCLPLNTPEQNN